MKLNEWLEPRGRKADLSRALGVQYQNVCAWQTGASVPIKYGAAIEAATGGAVTRQELFPDQWPAVWPELAAKEVAK